MTNSDQANSPAHMTAQARELVRDYVETSAGVETLRELAFTRRTVDQLTRIAVADARAGGLSWQEIGDALGITRQAAHERFRGLLPAGLHL